jgi:hypothetical protein
MADERQIPTPAGNRTPIPWSSSPYPNDCTDWDVFADEDVAERLQRHGIDNVSVSSHFLYVWAKFRNAFERWGQL